MSDQTTILPAHTYDPAEIVGPVTVQQASVLRLLARTAPEPLDVDALAGMLGVPRGRLLVTLRTLHRDRLVVAVRGRCSGWALADSASADP